MKTRYCIYRFSFAPDSQKISFVILFPVTTKNEFALGEKTIIIILYEMFGLKKEIGILTTFFLFFYSIFHQIFLNACKDMSSGIKYLKNNKIN